MIGIPELLIIFTLSLVWLLPVLVLVWAVLTLYRVRTGQDELRAKVDAIERMLRGS